VRDKLFFTYLFSSGKKRKTEKFEEHSRVREEGSRGERREGEREGGREGEIGREGERGREVGERREQRDAERQMEEKHAAAQSVSLRK